MSRAALTVPSVTSDLRTRPLADDERQLVLENFESRLQTIEGTRTLGIPLCDFRKDAAWKDPVDDAPGSSLLGLADTPGSPLLGNAANGTHKTDYAIVAVALPRDYTAGAAITLRVRAKIDTSLATVLSKVDVVAKVIGDAGVGSDICATAAQQVTAAYANYDFTVTPTSRVAGEVLYFQVLLDNDDTGGTNNKAMSVVAASLIYG